LYRVVRRTGRPCEYSLYLLSLSKGGTSFDSTSFADLSLSLLMGLQEWRRRIRRFQQIHVSHYVLHPYHQSHSKLQPKSNHSTSNKLPSQQHHHHPYYEEPRHPTTHLQWLFVVVGAQTYRRRRRRSSSSSRRITTRSVAAGSSSTSSSVAATTTTTATAVTTYSTADSGSAGVYCSAAATSSAATAAAAAGASSERRRRTCKSSSFRLRLVRSDSTDLDCGYRLISISSSSINIRTINNHSLSTATPISQFPFRFCSFSRATFSKELTFPSLFFFVWDGYRAILDEIRANFNSTMSRTSGKFLLSFHDRVFPLFALASRRR